ncbi:MAG: ATP-binding protein [Pirellulaceae bacterium]
MIQRNIIEIDEAKCDGCGLCVPACEEGAIRVVQGKARVVSETYCDGLGACLGHCPRGAISIVQRAAAPFDAAAVAEHLQAVQTAVSVDVQTSCPGMRSVPLPVLTSATPAPCAGTAASPSRASHGQSSQLANWPVQLHLLSPGAPCLQGADLLLVADCVPFACAEFHGRVLDGRRPVAIGCPKLDDGQAYLQKLSQIVEIAKIRSITVVHMEVPCCSGLLRIAAAAAAHARSEILLHNIVVTVRGQIQAPSETGTI